MSIQLKKINLKFDGENGNHIHILNGNPVPGCTSISSLFQQDGWKFAWPVKLMEEKALEQIMCKHQDDRTDRFIADVLKSAKNAWRQKRDKSADTGTIAHGHIEAFIKTGLVSSLTDKEVINCFNQFLKWSEKFNPEWLGSEIQVASETHRFAGILDALAMIDGKLTLVDFKTSASIKDDYAIQLAGLMICLEEMGCKPAQRAILHLPKEGEYEYRIIDGDLAEEKKDFLAGLAFYNRKNLFKARCK